MALGATVRIKGERELIMALKRAESDLKPMFEGELKRAADVVAGEASSRVSKYRGVGPIRGRLKGFTAIAESRARSRGIRPDFGSLLMRRGLLPARSTKMNETIRRVELALDRLGERNGF